ncbi:hypothetical protein [Shimia sp. Alg240-R146]|uniref:hypothetical protein n=1 Tax=Shimia sp. Alg240-R146 TaxID=2993449 RepID=UPI0022E1FD9D|nr:hypothetical protein [Shimia sp. Alg240-R146]
MATYLARLNDPEVPAMSWPEISDLFTPHLIQTMRTDFGLQGSDKTIRLQLGKILGRYQASAKRAHEPPPAPQTKDLERLKIAVDRTISAFDALSDKNLSEIDDAILYRDPFNHRFDFNEQLDYWEKNNGTSELTINKLKQVSHALKAVKAKRIEHAKEFKPTRNTPLDRLIQDLVMDFESGRGKKAKSSCYYDTRRDSYAGQFFDFVIFILESFAPRSYHSQVALGKRIERALKQMTG